MKIKVVSIALALSALSFSGGDDDKLTFKEKVEESKQVKVFFNSHDIKDEDDENRLRVANAGAKTAVRTTMPSEYLSSEIKTEVLKLLNEGLGVGGAFVEGDISTLPESNNRKTQFREVSKLTDGFYAIIDIDGEYKRTIEKKVVDGVTLLDVSNSMAISSHLFFYSVLGGEATKYGDMFMRSGVLLGNAKSNTIKSAQLEGLDYMEKNFPAHSFLPEYKETMYRFTKDFAEKQLKKHDKAVSKRK